MTPDTAPPKASHRQLRPPSRNIHSPVKAVEALVDTMVAKAGRNGATAADVAHGIVAALAHLRGTFAAQGGYAAMRSFDDALRTFIVAQGMDLRLSRGAEPRRIRSLPPAGPGAARAAAILRDAVSTGLLLNLWGPGNLLLQVAAGRLAVHLVEALGGALPDWTALEDWLAVDQDTALAGDPGPAPFPAGRLQ